MFISFQKYISKLFHLMRTRTLVLCLLVATHIGCLAYASSCAECDMSAAELIREWNYPLETHYVTTSDGFDLTLFRIPGSRHQSAAQYARSNRKPVLLMHALMDSSAAFVVNLPSQSLGFVLADAGFDVWLANNRGSTYSKPKRDDSAGWNWSFQESN